MPQPIRRQAALRCAALRRIATRSADAQRLFDVGMLHAYGYNQPAAIAAFEEGLAADAKAPMLYWGIAYASGGWARPPLPRCMHP